MNTPLPGELRFFKEFAPTRLDFPLKIHFLKGKQLQNPKKFSLRRAVSWEPNYIDFPYCPPQARIFLGYNFPPMGETLGGKFFTSPPWGGPWGGSSKKLPPHAMGGKLDPCSVQTARRVPETPPKSGGAESHIIFELLSLNHSIQPFSSGIL